MTSTFAQPVDGRVLRAAARGDMQAHGALYDQFSAPVYTLARRLVRRADIAEEILQEVFLDVIRRIGTYRNEAPFGAWLRRIAVNRCLMFLRSSWEEKSAPLDGEPATAGGLPADASRIDLAKLLDCLPPLGRTVLWLHEVEGYTHEEIGRLLGKTTSFSKSQLARGHARLCRLVGAGNENGTDHEVVSCTQTSND